MHDVRELGSYFLKLLLGFHNCNTFIRGEGRISKSSTKYAYARYFMSIMYIIYFRTGND